LIQAFGLPVWAAAVVVLPLMAALGYVLQRFVLNNTLGRDILPPLLVTFGLSVIVQNGLQLGFSADSRQLPLSGLTMTSFSILPGVSIGLYPAAVFGIAVLLIAMLQFILYHSKLGAIVRATSDDALTVRLMGIDNRHIFGIATALAFGVAGLAGILMGGYTNFTPTSGPQELLFGFEAIIIGGLGSLWGTLIGGVIIGVAQGFGALIDPGLQLLAGHLIFFAILLAAPRGLFPRMAV
jgi:branched-chain amino acid transport system permease protein